MATITTVESGVEAEVRIVRDDAGVAHLIVYARSFDAAGTVVRSQRGLDITADVPAGTRTGAENLLSNVEARLKAQWNISG